MPVLVLLGRKRTQIEKIIKYLEFIAATCKKIVFIIKYIDRYSGYLSCFINQTFQF